MTRREALSKVSLITGSVVVGGQLFLSCRPRKDGKEKRSLFRGNDYELISEIAETILPETATPGAKAAGVGGFCIVMVSDCYSDDEQRTFIGGLRQIEKRSLESYSKSFIGCSNEERHPMLLELAEESKAYMSSRKPNDQIHFFHMIKQLTLLGFFTSEVGATKALRYNPVPGKFDGCYPYEPGDRAWATV